MPCRVGMTTDPDERRRYWESQYPTLHDWVILGHYRSKSEAQKAETMFADKNGCVSHPGGDGPEIADWVVYGFRYRLMQHEPNIVEATEVKEIPLSTGRHTGVLLDDIVSSPGGILYRFALVVMDDNKNPCLYVTAETSSSALKKSLSGHGRDAFDAIFMASQGKISPDKIPEGEPYFLCAFRGDRHENYGPSAKWGDIDKFEGAAVKVAEDALKE